MNCKSTIPGLLSAMLLSAGIAACNDSTAPDKSDPRYEVWVVDQSNSAGLMYGGTIYIFGDSALKLAGATIPQEKIDLGAATASMCMSSTGAQPVRPHTVAFNATGTHAVVAFVASGHVALLNTVTRAPIACVRTVAGAGGGQQAHHALVSPDQSMILVANQNGKRLERIDANFVSNTFTLNAAAALDLSACTTPSGAACESVALRPDNAPILVEFDGSGSLAFATLRGGGMFAVNPRTTPMAIRAEYDSATLKTSGLAPLRVGNSLFVSAGRNAFRLYRLPLASFSSTTAAAPNTPAPVVMASTVADGSDAHGMAAVGRDNLVWVADRGLNRIDIFDPRGTARVSTIQLDGPISSDPAPDLVVSSPAGDLVFVTLKGVNPLSGGALGTGITPGVGLIRVDQNGRAGSFLRVVPISNRDAGGVERADPHGIAMRLR